MKDLPEPIQQLIDRKLWPVALLLLVALVAIPMLLKSDSETGSLPSPVTAAPAQGAEAAVVTAADPAKTDAVRAVLGNRKDPFRPAQLRRVPKEETDGINTATAAKSDVLGTGAGTSEGGGEPKPSSEPAPPVATATPAPEKTYDLYSLKVRFGSTDGELVTREVKRLTGLPGGTNPAVLYLGLLEDHKSAVFIVDAGVKVLGDGHCDPSPTDCQTLTMRKGETQFLTRGDKQWELDLVDIKVKKTKDAAAAKASRRAIAAEGRDRLRPLLPRIGAYRYDESAGALEVLPKAELAKRVAKAALRAVHSSG